MTRFLFSIGCLCIALGVYSLLVAYLASLVSEAVRATPRRLPRLARRLTWLCAAVLIAASIAACVLFGNPIYGLGVLVLAPFLLSLAVKLALQRQNAEREASAIAFFHALRGLVRAGLSLPYALFRLAETLPSPFARALRPFLDRYEGGRSLELCLERFRARADLRRSGICLSVLQMAYRDGLPVAPFLDRMLPLLEAERAGREREASLRRSVAFQAIAACAMPWFLASVLEAFQPEMAAHLASPRTLAIAGLALTMEGVGAWVLWQVSIFC